MDVFLQQLINGLFLGCVYALIALGYTMVYGIIELINFAHGEIFMVGSYLAFFIASVIGLAGVQNSFVFILGLLLVFIFAMSICGILGMTIERFAYKPLRTAPRLAPLLTAIGVSIVLQNAVMLIAGPEPKPFPEIFPVFSFSFGSITITALQIFIIVFSLLLMAILHILVKYTKLGKAMRATAQNRDVARLMGINVDRIISITFLIGSSLGAAGGVMWGMYYGQIDFYIGFIGGLKAFTAAVLGGIGNIPGAMLGGITLGILESLGSGYISAQWKDVIAFSILLLVLIFKPSGLLGENIPEKA